jgi:hypothetical protein
MYSLGICIAITLKNAARERLAQRSSSLKGGAMSTGNRRDAPHCRASGQLPKCLALDGGMVEAMYRVQPGSRTR